MLGYRSLLWRSDTLSEWVFCKATKTWDDMAFTCMRYQYLVYCLKHPDTGDLMKKAKWGVVYWDESCFLPKFWCTKHPIGGKPKKHEKECWKRNAPSSISWSNTRSVQKRLHFFCKVRKLSTGLWRLNTSVQSIRIVIGSCQARICWSRISHSHPSSNDANESGSHTRESKRRWWKTWEGQTFRRREWRLHLPCLPEATVSDDFTGEWSGRNKKRESRQELVTRVAPVQFKILRESGALTKGSGENQPGFWLLPSRTLYVQRERTEDFKMGWNIFRVPSYLSVKDNHPSVSPLRILKRAGMEALFDPTIASSSEGRAC